MHIPEGFPLASHAIAGAVAMRPCVVQGAPGDVLGDDGLLAGARLERPWALTVGARLRALGLLPSDGSLPRDASGLAALPDRPGVPT